MEFRKMVTITLYARQQKRHRCTEQSFGLCGKRRGWDDLREQHCNMCIIICETHRQSRFNAWVGAQGWCTGMTQRDGMGREAGGGFRMGNTCTPMADSCQCMAKPIQYCKVKKINKTGKKRYIVILTKTKQCRKEHLSFSPWEPQTPFSSSGTLDFLSAYLGIDTLRNFLIHL